MSLVYLSGPISGLTYTESTDWRHSVREALRPHGVIGLSPMRGKQFLDGCGAITDGMKAFRKQALATDSAIVARDRWDTQRSDFVLCNLLGASTVSIGTMMELAWADTARVPVLTVMEARGGVHEHPFVRQLSAYRVETLDDAVAILLSALVGVA